MSSLTGTIGTPIGNFNWWGVNPQDTRTFSEVVLDLLPITYHKLDEPIGTTTVLDSSPNTVNVNVGSIKPTYRQPTSFSGAPFGIKMGEPLGDPDIVIKTGNTLPQTLGDVSIISAVTLPTASTARQAIIQTTEDGDQENINNTWALYLDAGVLTMFWEYGAGLNETVYGPTLPLGVDTFVCAVRDVTAKTVTFYVNGAPTVVSYSNNPTGGELGKFVIGSWINGGNRWEGVISDTAVYHSILSTADVQLLYSKL